MLIFKEQFIFIFDTADISTPSRFKNSAFWLVFIAYTLCVGISAITHEPWGDELQTWDLIKGSTDLFNLLSNNRYDGHPAVWYILLFMFSKLTHVIGIIQLVAFLTSCAVGFLFVFYSRFPIALKILALSGYYFVFEYALFSRNYFIAVLTAFLICINLNNTYRFRYVVYYVLLFLLANSHFFTLFMAAAFHLFFLLLYREENGAGRKLVLQACIGVCILLSCFCFIFLPSELAPASFDWLRNWDAGRLTITAQAPLRAFMPIPDWWRYHFWNTNAIWDVAAEADSFFLKLCAIGVSVLMVLLAIFILFKNKKALTFFCFNLFCLLCLSTVFPLVNARHVGLIYIGFLISLWLSADVIFTDHKRKIAIYFLLALQLPGAFIALSRDWALPFSQVRKTGELIAAVPSGQPLITDYWGLNYLSAVTDKPYYCVESKQEQLYLVATKKWLEDLMQRDRYTTGIGYFLEKNQINSVFFLCNAPPLELDTLDRNFNKQFIVKLLIAKNDAIERFSNHYLYQVSKRAEK